MYMFMSGMHAEYVYKKASVQSKIELLLSFVKRLAHFSLTYTFHHTRWIST